MFPPVAIPLAFPKRFCCSALRKQSMTQTLYDKRASGSGDGHCSDLDASRGALGCLKGYPTPSGSNYMMGSRTFAINRKFLKKAQSSHKLETRIPTVYCVTSGGCWVVYDNTLVTQELFSSAAGIDCEFQSVIHACHVFVACQLRLQQLPMNHILCELALKGTEDAKKCLIHSCP